MTKQWWKESVVYQIYPRSFMDSNGDGIGDLRGIISKLDYLKKLGIDVIWLSPVYESPNDDNGYDISDYQKIMDEFGTMNDWDELLSEMHTRNMKLMMDLVVNHTSDEHNWFIESRKSKDNLYRDYYIWRPGKEGKEPNNWGAAFSGSAWQYDEATDEYYLHLFSKKQPDLNWDNERVRKDIYEMMKFWLEKGIDGFRMDVINFISKEEGFPAVKTEEKGYVSGHQHFMNGPNIHTYLHEMNQEVLSQYDIMTVGEMPGVTTEEAKLYTAEDRQELQMVFQFEHMDLDSGEGGKWDVKPCSLLTLKQNLTKWQKALEQTGWNSLYWNNHDQPRVVSRFGNDTTYRTESAKMLATVLHMMKGTPYIYQGEEIGMTNVHFDSIDEYRDIETLNMYREKVIEHGENEEKVMQSIYIKGRDNARTPMQWDASECAGFTTGEPWIGLNPNYKEINVEQALQEKNSIFYYYKKLIELRKKHEMIIYGTYDLILEEHPSIFAYVRTWKDEKLLVIANFTEDVCVFELPEEIAYSSSELLIHNYDVQEVTIESISLQPYETRVYIVK
ncbi:glycoside hydrolase family 13 protein [Bacillus gaemokensis]|uniref:oligo-1,6-glucosidase n=1 Tax=Bacillus gaemokensis TaxID=574375 RepID=A0A073KUC3_9BACI|nr:alpha-glucosidase [Bacillus gaemokensis]KEK25948.1 oligo-1,6-glucosidase [Bacillus gaemokensis]KYG38760.1 glucohydrolase [Bacillus gaemokensis]